MKIEKIIIGNSFIDEISIGLILIDIVNQWALWTITIKGKGVEYQQQIKVEKDEFKNLISNLNQAYVENLTLIFLGLAKDLTP